MPANPVIPWIHRSNCRANAPKLPLNDSLLSSTLLSACSAWRLMPLSAVLACTLPQTIPAAPLPAPCLSGLSLPHVCHYFLTSESQFQSLHQDSVFFLPCGQCESRWLLAPALYQGSPSDLLCLLFSFCLFHLPEPSTPPLLSLWKGQIVRTNILQPPVPRAPCLSAPSILSSHSSCSRVSEFRCLHKVLARSQHKKLLRAL